MAPEAARSPAVGQSWRRAWGEVILFCAFPGDVRRILYTTEKIDKLFRRKLLPWSGSGDRVAKSRAGGCKLDRAAFSVVPRLRHPCGACTPRLPLADEPFVGLLGMPVGRRLGTGQYALHQSQFGEHYAALGFSL
jgi:hypothetical protein